MSASLHAPRRTPACMCVLTTVALINVGSIVQAAEVPSYCAELKQVAALALTRDKFASIIGAAREGNFLDSKVTLPGWGDCSFYGMRTYTCDSQAFKTADEGNAAHGKVLEEVKWICCAARRKAVGLDHHQHGPDGEGPTRRTPDSVPAKPVEGATTNALRSQVSGRLSRAGLVR